MNFSLYVHLPDRIIPYDISLQDENTAIYVPSASVIGHQWILRSNEQIDPLFLFQSIESKQRNNNCNQIYQASERIFCTEFYSLPLLHQVLRGRILTENESQWEIKLRIVRGNGECLWEKHISLAWNPFTEAIDNDGNLSSPVISANSWNDQESNVPVLVPLLNRLGTWIWGSRVARYLFTGGDDSARIKQEFQQESIWLLGEEYPFVSSAPLPYSSFNSVVQEVNYSLGCLEGQSAVVFIWSSCIEAQVCQILTSFLAGWTMNADERVILFQKADQLITIQVFQGIISICTKAFPTAKHRLFISQIISLLSGVVILKEFFEDETQVENVESRIVDASICRMNGNRIYCSTEDGQYIMADISIQQVFSNNELHLYNVDEIELPRLDFVLERPSSSVLRLNHNTVVRFFSDFRTRTWITYRCDFPLISGSWHTTDVGWGCMIRTGQMLLCEGFHRLFLGRGFRYQEDSIEERHHDIINLFHDTPKSSFSIHNIALRGVEIGMRMGDWFSPSTVANAVRMIADSRRSTLLPMNIIVAMDGTVNLKKLTSPCVLLIPVRAGLDRINSEYFPSIKNLFRDPCFLGIAGGRPSRSLYFVAYQGDELFYLDPHISRTFTKSPDYLQFHCDDVRSIQFDEMDPSMLLGFAFRSSNHINMFVQSFRNQNRYSLFSIVDNADNVWTAPSSSMLLEDDTDL